VTSFGPVVSLRPITDANREAVEVLSVAPDQRCFVSGVRESILEAAGEPDAHALFWASYSEEMPVGFVMIADEVGSPRLHSPVPLEAAHR
jgi:diamine N-acetyltransferase